VKEEKTMKLSIEVNEDVWKEVDVEVESTDEDGTLEFVEGVVVEGVDAFGEALELEVVRFDPKDGTCDLFSFDIGGLDTVKAKEVK
jgi:hypothetical protein